MTPGEEAAYALDWELPSDSLDPAVQLVYDRLKAEREGRPWWGQAATARDSGPGTQVPGPLRGRPGLGGRLGFDFYPWLAVAVFLVWAAFFIWVSEGANITGYQMNFRTLRSDLSKVHLPAGYEKVSSSESGTDCRERTCALMEFWVWRADGAHTAAQACRDVSRAMRAGLPGVDAEVASFVPRGAACEYDTVLASFFRPGLGKRSAEALVWVNGKAKGSPGGYRVELLAAYNYPPG